MARFGYLLSCEEWNANNLIEQAEHAQRAGFDLVGISDSFHPWNDEQGSSSFVWTVIGALSGSVDLPIATHVTAPIFRTHPAIIAQAAATADSVCRGGLALGVGTGTALNDQIFGNRWPLADERLEMLDEAVALIRALWSGTTVTFRGKHYTIEHARLFGAPQRDIPIYVSGAGPEAIKLAARIGDGYVSSKPDRDALGQFRAAGGADHVAQAGLKLCYGPDAAQAVDTASRLWSNAVLPDQLTQDLRTREHFRRATSLVRSDDVASAIPCGPNLNGHVAAIQAYVDAGFDEILMQQIGPWQNEFFQFAADALLPALRSNQSTDEGT